MDFEKIELKIGKILKAEKLVGYNKILKVTVDLGIEKREIMSGISKFYNPDDLTGKYVVVCTNLEPKKFGENTSFGMILAADGLSKPVLLTVGEDVEPGTSVL